MDCEGGHKVQKKKTVKKHKTSKKKRKHDSSGDESVDISEKIFPITHYINDKEEMMKQVFSVMEKEKLNCMLPPILKGMTMAVLRDRCLQELRNMSEDEIHKVLCGEPLAVLAKNVSKHSKGDSGSAASVSSVEECVNEGKEKKTLLDILEQEMQEIAYNTVLKDTSPSIHESEDELPEIVAIIPLNSPADVPVICLDSGDDEPALSKHSSQPNSISISTSTVHNSQDTNKAQELCSPPRIQGNKIIPENDHQSTAQIKNQIQCPTNVKPPTSESRESFLIQVFPKTLSSTGRIVKKVYGLTEKAIPAVRGEPVDEDVIEFETPSRVGTSSSNPISELEKDHQIVLSKPSEMVQEEKSIAQSELSFIQLNEVCDKSVMETAEKVIDLETWRAPVTSTNKKVCSVDSAQLEPDREKEEGEITGGESEEDVEIPPKIVGTTGHRSPTISLSSGSVGEKSDGEDGKSRVKVHKHRHKHRRSKRSSESPERPRRCIEKRGHRSYRRQAPSPNKAAPTCDEKATEPSEQNEEPVLPPSPVEGNLCLDDIELPPSPPLPSVPPVSLVEVASNVPITQECIIDSSKDCSSTESRENSTKENVETQNHVKSGVTSDLQEEADKEAGAAKTSWADRWAEKKDLKKVVITSKICRNVRKKILSARKKKANQEAPVPPPPPLPPVPPLVLHVEGSVQEYQMLQFLDFADGQLRVEANDVPTNEHLGLPRGQHEVDSKISRVCAVSERDNSNLVLSSELEVHEPQHEVLNRVHQL